MSVESVRAVFILEVSEERFQIVTEGFVDEEKVDEVPLGPSRRNRVDLHAADVHKRGDAPAQANRRLFEQRIAIMEQADLRAVESSDQCARIRIIGHEAAQIPEGVVEVDDVEFHGREEIEVLGPAVTDMKGAARASSEIERSHETLPGKNLEGRYGGWAQYGFEHGLWLQDERPVMGALPGDPPAPGQNLFYLTSGVLREEPSHGLVIPQFQNPLDDIFFVFLKIDTVRFGVPKKVPTDIRSLFHLCDYITFGRRAEPVAGRERAP